MKRILIAVIVLFTVLIVVEDCQARWRLFGRRRYSNNYTYYNSSYSSNYSSVSSWGSSPQEVADAKARYLASRNAMFHPGGGYGGGNAEGVGAGMTAQQALNNCCFTGQRRLLGSACYQGSNGMWYACKIFQ